MTLKPKAAPRFARLAPDARRTMLIEAGLACLGKSGISGFTIDRISTEADVSRGLITHHFGSKDGFLAAVYETMIGSLIADIESVERIEVRAAEDHIRAIIDSVFSLSILNRESLKIWLALWGEIANNPVLQQSHRTQYARYCACVERAIKSVSDARSIEIEVRPMAVMFVALVDGLWLEWCIDPGVLSVQQAREACYRLLTPILGPLQENP